MRTPPPGITSQAVAIKLLKMPTSNLGRVTIYGVKG